tara:strand:- start:119 stop:487 length:369 start_codon:yes stop_codon:yes gene_type:complete
MDKETKSKIALALFNGAKNGGITLTRDGEPINKGYSVAVATDETTCCSGSDQEILDCIVGFVDRISDKSDNNNVGVWFDEEEGVYVLDLTRNVNTQRTATLIGWLHRQKAIYNHNKKEEVFI